MIKKITLDQLVIGMYIHDINCGWMDHPFARNRFKIDKPETLDKIRSAGVAEVFIDTSLGADVPGEEEAEEAIGKPAQPEAAARSGQPLPDERSSSMSSIVKRFSPAEEFEHARMLYSDANDLVQDIMKDARLGKQITRSQCDPLVDDIVESMFRFPSALLPLSQIKNYSEYTFQHSVAVSALAVAFGRVLELPRDEIKELSLGGMLHDIGKALVPGHILNKPGKLEDSEFEIMKGHVSHTAKLLNNVEGLSEIAYNAAVEHHERHDGKGYPRQLKRGMR